MPVNQEADSIDQLQRIEEQAEKRLFLRRAAQRGSQRQVSPFMTSPSVRKQLRKEFGGKEITMTQIATVAGRGIEPQKSHHHRSGRGRATSFAGPPATPNLAAKTLRRNRIGGGTVAAHKTMSAPAKPTPPDFDEEFLQAIAEWRRNSIKSADDDAV